MEGDGDEAGVQKQKNFVSVFMNIFVVIFIARCSLMEKQLKKKKKACHPVTVEKGTQGKKMSKKSVSP